MHVCHIIYLHFKTRQSCTVTTFIKTHYVYAFQNDLKVLKWQLKLRDNGTQKVPILFRSNVDISF